VFTASHQTYADAILDYVDPDNELFQYRLYRQHCVQTPEGYYVKDLRIIRNRAMKDMVIVDNSVYSFAYQIDNGIPIIPFYHEPSDEEMLHLIFYLDCLSTCDDVREQNREAFELYKLADQD
jgi:CTD small phosphatase-like protein 2